MRGNEREGPFEKRVLSRSPRKPLRQNTGRVECGSLVLCFMGALSQAPGRSPPPRRARPTRPAFRLSRYRVMSHSPAEAGSAPGSRHWRPKTKKHRPGSFRRTLSCALFQSFRGGLGTPFSKGAPSASPSHPPRPPRAQGAFGSYPSSSRTAGSTSRKAGVSCPARIKTGISPSGTSTPRSHWPPSYCVPSASEIHVPEGR